MRSKHIKANHGEPMHMQWLVMDSFWVLGEGEMFKDLIDDDN